MTRAYEWLSTRPQHRRGIAVLQVAIGMACLFRVVTESPFSKFLWGPNGIGHGTAARWFGPPGALLDTLFATERGTYLLLVLLGVGASGLILQTWTRAATLLTLLTSSMLNNRLPELGDGGDNIAHLVLIYLCFALPSRQLARPGSLRTWIHNIAVVAIGAQLAVLYFTSGILKASGPQWQNGTALYAISQVEWFSTPSTRDWFKNPFVVTFATYSTVLFQLWFPIALFTPARLAFIAVGIFFHLGIAFSMGLITFSTVMIGLELFLISDADYSRGGRIIESIQLFIRRSVERASDEPEVASPSTDAPQSQSGGWTTS